MKRFLTILAAALLLTAVMAVSVSASSFDSAAEELSAIGIFKGSAGGFQLDQAPTRSQAAIMLVRLYGAEDEAKASFASGEIKCPFTDVGETAAPYVAWLSSKGLANGVSATSFGASNPCTAKAYTIFLLRALGYQDNADFTTADAQTFAQSIGLLDTSVFTGKFLRDDLAALTYQALATDLKDGSTYLLDSLIKSGAIDASAAKVTTDKIEAYRSLQSVTMDTMGNALDTDIRMKANTTYSMKGQTGGQSLDMSEKMDMTASGNAKVIMGEDGMQMAMNLSLKMEEETVDVELWLKDGVMYIRSGEEAYQQEIPGMADLYVSAMSGRVNASLLPFVDSIDSKASSSDTVYTLKLNDALAGMVNSLVSLVLNTDAELAGVNQMDISMDGSSFTYTVISSGALKKAAANINVTVGMDMDMQGVKAALEMAMKMDMDMDVKATGKDVKITFPDFSGFEKAPSATPAPIPA